MKDCRYCFKNKKFVVNYNIIDNIIIINYDDNTEEKFLYTIEKEKEVLLKLKQQINDNILFKKFYKRNYYISKLFFPFCVVFFVNSSFDVMYDFNFENLFNSLLMTSGLSYDFYLQFGSEKKFKEILKEEYFLANKEILGISYNDIANYSFSEIKDIVKSKIKKN